MKLLAITWMLSGIISFIITLGIQLKKEGISNIVEVIKNNDIKHFGLLIKFIIFGPICLYLVYSISKKED
jgi:hypothetical protein